MNKFDEYMDEYVEDIAGNAVKRRYSMSLPRVEFIRQVFDEVYQRGYRQAMGDSGAMRSKGRKSNG